MWPEWVDSAPRHQRHERCGYSANVCRRDRYSDYEAVDGLPHIWRLWNRWSGARNDGLLELLQFWSVSDGLAEQLGSLISARPLSKVNRYQWGHQDRFKLSCGASLTWQKDFRFAPDWTCTCKSWLQSWALHLPLQKRSCLDSQLHSCSLDKAPLRKSYKWPTHCKWTQRTEKASHAEPLASAQQKSCPSQSQTSRV